jgi:hypothetical protein
MNASSERSMVLVLGVNLMLDGLGLIVLTGGPFWTTFWSLWVHAKVSPDLRLARPHRLGDRLLGGNQELETGGFAYHRIDPPTLLDRLDELSFVHDVRWSLAGQSCRPSSPNEDRSRHSISLFSERRARFASAVSERCRTGSKRMTSFTTSPLSPLEKNPFHPETSKFHCETIAIRPSLCQGCFFTVKLLESGAAWSGEMDGAKSSEITASYDADTGDASSAS